MDKSRDELLLLGDAQQTLEELSTTLSNLARRFGAEELTLHRALEWMQSQRVQHEELENALAEMRRRLEEQEAELAQFRKQKSPHGELPPQTTPQPASPSHNIDYSVGESLSRLLLRPPKISMPDGFLEGLSFVAGGCDLTWRFCQAEAERSAAPSMEGFASGLHLISRNLGRVLQNMKGQITSDGTLAPTVLRWWLHHDILPAFDDLYRCLHSLQASLDLPALMVAETLTEKVLSAFLSVLMGAELRPLYPLGQRFDPKRHEASARVERQDFPVGTIVEVVQVGFLLRSQLLRPAWVAVVCAPEPG